MTRQEFIDALNQKFNGTNYTFSLDKPGAKFTRVVRGRLGLVYCFLDVEGNIYKTAGWKAPAEGIRSTLDTVDISKVDPYGSWLYR